MTRSAAALVVLCAAGLWAVSLVRNTGTIETEAAVRRMIALADGSTAELNARSRLETDFRYGRRVVTLTTGEAYFNVAKDVAHPFLVETPAGTIRVTGTAFNVRIAANGQAEVTLFEGSVVVHDPDSERVALEPEQQLRFGVGQSQPRLLDRRALAGTTAWREGNMVLDTLTLAEAMERLGAYHAVTIAVDPSVAGLAPGGAFPMADLKAFLAALEGVLPVQVIRRDERHFAVLPR